ncbi:MAG: serpin family protein, partial [Archangium sp.]|nr:serpin family protein [Archangium sp.]
MNTSMKLSAAVVVAAMTGCAGIPEAPGTEAASSLARLTTAAPAPDLAKAVTGHNELALRLYRELRATRPGNVFFSPTSISVALSMTLAGAAGTTAQEFSTVLASTLDPAAHHVAMNDLDRQLRSRGAGAKSADGKAFRLVPTNQIFSQRGLRVKQPFLDTLAQQYGAGVRLLDFAAQPEPARQSINSWVAQSTEQRIPELLQPSTIDPATQLVLINAIYFNAAWRNAFEPAQTQPGQFHALSGATPTVRFMNNHELNVRAGQVDGVEVVELPYDGDELSFIALMPPVDALGSFEQSLTAAALEATLSALHTETLDLALPTFELRYGKSLKAPLHALGLQSAFSGDADFSGISDGELVVSDVVH